MVLWYLPDIWNEGPVKCKLAAALESRRSGPLVTTGYHRGLVAAGTEHRKIRQAAVSSAEAASSHPDLIKASVESTLNVPHVEP